VGFDDATAAALRAFGPHCTPHFGAIIDEFYARAWEHPEARAVFRDQAMIERLKVSLREWLTTLFEGPYDEAYYARRARIGRVHVRIKLDQRYMFTAMNVVRIHLQRVARVALADDPAALADVQDAVAKVLDLELAIMLETYREDSERALKAHERLATIGQLGASIGHEIRNPLGVIASSAYILRRRVADDEYVRGHLDKIQGQVNLANQSIGDLLALARERPPERHPITPRALIARAVAAAYLPPTVDVEIDAPEATLSLDPGQFEHALRNLLANAAEAMEGRGRIVVRCSVADGAATLVVEDEGPGLLPEAEARLFEALFTTKTSGTGLGLALVRQIVARHGGTVTAANRPEGGARFTVHLPNAVTD
jgi:signal transduction histidine kinase